MDARDRELLSGSLRELLATPDVDVPNALVELGWEEVVSDDPAAAVTLLFAEHGRALARSNALDRVVLAELPLTGNARRAVLYPPMGAPEVVDEGVLLADPAGMDEVVAPVRGGVAVVPVEHLVVTEVSGFDPDARWRLGRLTGSGTQAGFGAAAAPHLDDAAWRSALGAGRRALSAELNAITETALRIAVEHTTDRVQYGRPIASYQSVRHRLAEGHAILEASRSLLDAAWVDGSVWAATAAKAQAGQAYLDVCRHAMQLCGAIGLTHEHRLRRYVQRGAMLDGLLGSSRELQHEIGAALLTGFDPPRVVEL